MSGTAALWPWEGNHSNKNVITSVSGLSVNNESILLCDIFLPKIVFLYIQENMQYTHPSLLETRKKFIVLRIYASGAYAMRFDITFHILFA